MVAVGRVRMVAVGRVRMVAVEDEEFAFAVRRGAGGTFGVGVGGSDGVSLHGQGCADLSHRAAQLEEEQHTCEHRVAGCTRPESPESPGSTSRQPTHFHTCMLHRLLHHAPKAHRPYDEFGRHQEDPDREKASESNDARAGRQWG